MKKLCNLAITEENTEADSELGLSVSHSGLCGNHPIRSKFWCKYYIIFTLQFYCLSELNQKPQCSTFKISLNPSLLQHRCAYTKHIPCNHRHLWIFVYWLPRTGKMLENQVHPEIWHLEVLSLPQIMKLSKIMNCQPCS